MQTSIFLAKLMGPMLLVMGLVGLVHPERIRQMAREFLDHEALIFVSGVIALPVGLAIVNTHNVWAMGWPLIITFFGWLTVFAGVTRMAFPGMMKTLGNSMIGSSTYIAVHGALISALGAYMSYQGYLA